MPHLLPVIVAVLCFLMMGAVIALVAASVRTQREIKRTELTHRLRRSTVVETRVLGTPAPVESPRGERLRRLVHHAGGTTTVNRVITWTVGLGLVGMAALAIAVGPKFAPVGVLLSLLPWWRLTRQAAARCDAMSHQLPDAFDHMGRALRAGHAFPEVLRSTARDIGEPLGPELALVAERNRLGIEMRQAVLELAQRNDDNFDVQLFVSMVMLHQQTGGNLIETLGHLADTMRQRGLARDKLRAVTAEVRMSAMIVGSLPFFVASMLLWIRPEYLLPLIEIPLGQKLLGVAIGSLSIGFTMMRRLATVEE